MPKLRSVHFSRVGHPDARLDPLCLDFTDDQGPTDTILWLDNGGGKTSIVQLLFSVFIPNKREFLGTVKGATRTYDQYFIPGDVGIVASVWDLGEGQPARVIGRCVHRKTSSEELDSAFFSFLLPADGSGVPLKALPLRQFKGERNPGGIGTISQFHTYMRELFQEQPQQELAMPGTQRDWLDKLRSWGFEPDLFRLLLRLNHRESSADSMLDQINSTDKLIRVLVALLADQHRMETLDRIIREHRGKLRTLPDLRLEQQLFESLHKVFSDLVEPGTRLVEARKAAKQAADKREQAARSILATRPYLAKKQQEVEDKKASIEEQVLKQKEHIATLQAHESWLQVALAEFFAKEAGEHLDQCESAEQSLQLDLDYLNAATLLIEIENGRQHCRNLAATIEEAGRPAAEHFQTLNALGARLVALYDEKLESSQRNIIREVDQKKKNDQQQQRLEKESWEVGETIGVLQEKNAGLRAWHEKMAKERAALFDEGTLLADETATAAVERHQSEQSCLGSERVTLSAQLERLRKVEKEFSSKKEGLRQSLEIFERRVEELEEEKAFFGEARANISRNSALRLLLQETDDIDPYLPGLDRRIAHHISTLTRQAEELGFDLRREEQALSYMEEGGGLMPPAEDVLKVVSALQAQQIPAVPYVRYLSENRLIPEAVREKLLKDPARFGGVGLLNPNHLDHARDTVKRLPHLRGPVQVTPVTLPENAAPTAAESVVALPNDDGTFDITAAAELFRSLRQRVESMTRARERLLAQNESLQEAGSLLAGFYGRYPAGTAELFGERRQDLSRKLEEASRKLEETSQRLEDIASQIGQVGERIDQIGVERQQLAVQQVQLARFVQDFEKEETSQLQDLSRYEEEEKTARKRLEEISEDLTITKQEHEQISNRLHHLIMDAENIQTQKDAVAYADESKGRLPANLDDFQIQSVKSRYNATLAIYKEKSQAAESLRGQWELVDQQVKKGQGKMRELYGELDSQRIQKTLETHADGISLEEINSASANLKTAVGHTAKAKLLKQQKELDLNAKRDKNRIRQAPPGAERLRNGESCRSELEHQHERQRQADEVMAELVHMASKAEDTRKNLERSIKALNRLIENVQELCPVEENGPYSALQDDEACQVIWDQAQLALATAEKEERKLHEEVEQIKSRAEKILTREDYQRIVPHVRRQIAESSNHWHQEATNFASNMADRAQSLEDSIQGVDEHKKEILMYLSDEVQTVMSNLRTFEALSKLPEHGGAWAIWSGRSFFRVGIEKEKHKRDEHAQAHLDRYLETLIRCSDESFPTSPLHIIQESAVAALRGMTRITTLKPDKHPSLRPVPLEEVGGFSGGQKLMFTILAFMNLARLCHNVHQVHESGGHLLILDNPIGECNLTNFVDLQRECAKILNIQLVYPTGIKDHKVISLFPRLVSLRNERIDRRTQFKHVETESLMTDSLRSLNTAVANLALVGAPSP